MLETKLEELNFEITDHLEQLSKKFVTMIYEAVQPRVAESGNPQKWDEVIPKGQIVEPNAFIQTTIETIKQI